MYSKNVSSLELTVLKPTHLSFGQNFVLTLLQNRPCPSESCVFKAAVTVAVFSTALAV